MTGITAKADEGAAIFTAYAEEKEKSPFEDQAATMTALLAALMHHAHEWDIDFAACQEAAHERFEVDRECARDEA
jgi:hypothetical protein